MSCRSVKAVGLRQRLDPGCPAQLRLTPTWVWARTEHSPRPAFNFSSESKASGPRCAFWSEAAGKGAPRDGAGATAPCGLGRGCQASSATGAAFLVSAGAIIGLTGRIDESDAASSPKLRVFKGQAGRR